MSDQPLIEAWQTRRAMLQESKDLFARAEEYTAVRKDMLQNTGVAWDRLYYLIRNLTLLAEAKRNEAEFVWLDAILQAYGEVKVNWVWTTDWCCCIQLPDRTEQRYEPA